MSSIKTGRSASLTGPSAIKFCEWSGAIPPVDPTTGKYAQDIDVLFCGSMNERRMQIIQALKDSTLFDKPLVIAQFVGYGAYRDKYIARSKIVLNMHYYTPGIFEIARVSYLLANKKCVVSEEGLGDGAFRGNATRGRARPGVAGKPDFERGRDWEYAGIRIPRFVPGSC